MTEKRKPHYTSQVKGKKELVIYLPWEPEERVASVGFAMRVLASRFEQATGGAIVVKPKTARSAQ